MYQSVALNLAAQTQPTGTLRAVQGPPSASASSDSSLAKEPLSRADYPRVHFWVKGDWIGWLNENQRLEPGSVSKKRRYMENEHGEVISTSRASEMR